MKDFYFSVYTSYFKTITYASNKSTCPKYKEDFVADIKHVTGKSNEPFHERGLTDYIMHACFKLKLICKVSNIQLYFQTIHKLKYYTRERERERERSQRHSLLRIKMERDLSIFLDRSCKRVWLAIEYSYRKREREREKKPLKEKEIQRCIKQPLCLGPLKRKEKKKEQSHVTF